MINEIIALDIRLFRLINSGLYNESFASIISFLANDIVVVSGAAVILFIVLGRFDKKARISTAFALWALIAADLINWKILKPLFKRPRPFAELEDVNLLVPLKSYGWAFPSTHAALSMAFAAVLWQANKRKRPYLAAFVLGVAFFSVYTGGHYPMDILAGWVIGIFTGLIFRYLMNMTERKIK